MGTISSREAVLIPLGLESKGYSCVRSPAEHGVRTIAASQYKNVPAGSSRFCDETVWIPSPSDDLMAYRDRLLEIASRDEIRTILPTRPYDTYLFTRYRTLFDQHVSVVTPSEETLDTIYDRHELAAAAENAGVPVPDTELLSVADAEDRERRRIVKSRYNLLADAYLDTLTERESVVEKSISHYDRGEPIDKDGISSAMGHDPIVQEYIPSSHEYVFGALYDHGEPLATFQHRQIRGNSYTGGGGVYRKTTDIPALDRVGRELLGSIDFHGIACIEYMKHEDTGEFYLTEINPRLWQSVPCAVRAGAEFPWFYYLQATGRPDLIEPAYDVGLGTHQLYGEVGYLKSLFTDESPIVERPSIPGTLWELTRSMYEDPRFDDFRADDPLPFVRSVQHLVRKGAAAVWNERPGTSERDASPRAESTGG